jgi:hypothetical protein
MLSDCMWSNNIMVYEYMLSKNMIFLTTCYLIMWSYQITCYPFFLFPGNFKHNVWFGFSSFLIFPISQSCCMSRKSKSRHAWLAICQILFNNFFLFPGFDFLVFLFLLYPRAVVCLGNPNLAMFG